VQFTGRSTYVLSLPKKWIEEMHLKAGDQVTLARELDNSLSIVPIPTGPSESLNEVIVVIMPKDSSNTLRRKVVSIYLAGYNIIHLKLRSGRINPALRDTVREVVRRNLVGTEMVAEASDNITLQVLLSLPELSVNTAIRRMYLIASSCIRTPCQLLQSSTANWQKKLSSQMMKSIDSASMSYAI
jgi:phosphate uptake regulator